MGPRIGRGPPQWQVQVDYCVIESSAQQNGRQNELTITDLMVSLLVVVALRVIYANILSQWPDSYYSAEDLYAESLTRKLPKYFLFRFVPSLLILAIGPAFAESPRAVVVLSSIFYLLLIGGFRMNRLLHEGGRLKGLLVFAFSNLIFCFASVVAYFSTEWVSSILPPDEEIIGELIQALLIALMIFAFISLTDAKRHGSKRPDAAEAPEFSNAIVSAALENDADPKVLLAIGLAEEKQRPAWFRRLERGLGFFRPDGTFGLFQVRAERNVSDVESAMIAARQLSGLYPRSEILAASRNDVRIIAESHNPDPNFTEMVIGIYADLELDLIDSSAKIAPDGRPTVEVWSYLHFANLTVLQGTVWGADGLVARIDDRCLRIEYGSASVKRTSWYACVPHGSRKLVLRFRGIGLWRNSMSINLNELVSEREPSIKGRFGVGTE